MSAQQVRAVRALRAPDRRYASLRGVRCRKSLGCRIVSKIESEYGPPERVYVENDWWDGPRSGVADVLGSPHRFASIFDDESDGWTDAYIVYPIDEETLRLELEQWAIFVEWNERYEAGEADTDSHPGQGGVSRRWDEIEDLLRERRAAAPPNATRATAEYVPLTCDRRYSVTGPDYALRWRLL